MVNIREKKIDTSHFISFETELEEEKEKISWNIHISLGLREQRKIGMKEWTQKEMETQNKQNMFLTRNMYTCLSFWTICSVMLWL